MSASGWKLSILHDKEDTILESHVIPLGDLVQHTYEEDCVCGPAAQMVEGGTWMYVHESLDRREDSE